MAALKIIITPTAAKDIERLDNALRQRIGDKILAATKDPLAVAKRLSDPRLGTHRIRAGDYRVIVDINDSELIVLRVGHRREIYRQ